METPDPGERPDEPAEFRLGDIRITSRAQAEGWARVELDPDLPLHLRVYYGFWRMLAKASLREHLPREGGA